jgi:hypothetical protein
MGQVNVYNLSGGNGSTYANAAGPHTGDFYAIQFVADTVVEALVGNMDNSGDLDSGEDNITFAKGDVIYGRYSSVTFDASGKAILYNA